jgi:endonuclease III
VRKLYTGAWFMEVLDSEETGLSWLVDLLREQYPKLGLSVDPQDPLHILIPVFLSQPTSYHGNVVKWCRRIWEMTDDPFKAAEIAPKIAESYQLRRLHESFPCLSSAISRNIWATRIEMMKCRYCGPKIADAFLLFGMADTTSAPVDRHFISMARKLELWDFELPRQACAENMDVQAVLPTGSASDGLPQNRLEIWLDEFKQHFISMKSCTARKSCVKNVCLDLSAILNRIRSLIPNGLKIILK